MISNQCIAVSRGAPLQVEPALFSLGGRNPESLAIIFQVHSQSAAEAALEQRGITFIDSCLLQAALRKDGLLGAAEETSY